MGDSSKAEEEAKAKRQAIEKRNKILKIVAVIVVAGCFIPFQRDTKSDIFEDGFHESYSYDTIEYAKLSNYKTQYCPDDASKCSEVFGYYTDALIFSKNGWINGNEKDRKIIFVSKSKKLYVDQFEASLDSGKNTISDITFKNAIDNVSGHSSSTEDCFIYGLYCPGGASHQHHHESITFNSDAKVKVFQSNCEKDISEDGYTFYNCSHGNYSLSSIRTILGK